MKGKEISIFIAGFSANPNEVNLGVREAILEVENCVFFLWG